MPQRKHQDTHGRNVFCFAEIDRQRLAGPIMATQPREEADLPSQRTNSTRNGDSSSPIDGNRVIHLRLHGRASWREPGLRRLAATAEPPVPGLEKYEYAHENDIDCRHRMLVNVLAAGVTAVLIFTGVWIMNSLLETRQDSYNCLGRGGSHCGAFYAPSR
jgi:hypothetical protein